MEKSKKGFGGMDPAKQREIAAKGGRVAHATGRAHQWTAAEAREAGKKGGEKVSQDHAHMAEIGRRGGKNRAKNQHTAAAAPSDGDKAAE